MILSGAEYSQQIENLTQLFKRSFNQDIHYDFFKWRYLNNPLNELLACVEFDKEQIIANYSASPVLMNVNGNKVRTALSMTTMTDPAYAGRGLFTKLANELYEFMSREHYSLIWGFPNKNSHRGFVSRLSWQDVYEIPTMNLKLSGNTDPNILIETDNNFDLEYKEQDPIQNGIYVFKSKEYLKWRYVDNPVNQYTNLVVKNNDTVSSFCVIKKYGDLLDIVDFQAKDPEEGLNLLRQVINFAVNENLTSINCWAPRHHFIHTICERLGFINKEPITYLGFRQLDQVKANLVSNNYSYWYIQMGDSDVY